MLAAAARVCAVTFPVISREEAEKRESVCVTGVVTCVAYWQRASCIIASPDDPNGRSVYVTGQHPDRNSTPLPEGGLSLGDLIEVDGKIAPMMFAPGVAAYKFTRVGRMDLPEAPMHKLGDFVFGRLDNRRTRCTGVVRSVRGVTPEQTRLTLGTPDGDLSVNVHAPIGPLDPLTDALVELNGIVMSRYNHRAEFLGVRLEVSGMDGVRVLRSAPEDPFSANELPLGSIMAWRPNGPDGHRVRVRGVVTAAFDDGVFYLQSGNAAVRAVGSPPEQGERPPAVGTEVEAVGFPEMIGGVGQLAGALWRISGDGKQGVSEGVLLPLSDMNLTNLAFHADLTYVDYDCRLVQMTGRLYRLKETGDGVELMLDVDGTSVGVSVPGAAPKWILDEYDFEPMLQVTGIARLDVSAVEAGGRRPGLASVRIEARGADDIVLAPDAEWTMRKRRHVARWGLNALAASSFIFLVVAVWFWRRARERKREMQILAAERRRMADDLHDTIEQHLAGVRIILSSVRGKLPAEGSGHVDKALGMAANILNEAKGEIREVIMNLRSDRMISKPLEAALKEFAEATNKSGAVRVRCSLRGLDVDLAAVVKSDIMMIVQQATANAIKHGAAKNVLIASDPKEGSRGFVLRILNDGTPFDADKMPGPELGHFGLSNMRERAKKSHMGIAFGQVDGMVAITLTVPDR